MSGTAIWLAILGPLLTFAGLFIGAYFARSREAAKYRQDRITEAYTAYIDAVAGASGPRVMQVMQKLTTGQALASDELAAMEAANARFVTAHSAVLIYGSKEVVSALSHFYDTGGDPRKPASRDAYLALVRAMRRDSDAADYDAFDGHVDNILVTGPMKRQAAMTSIAAH
ncbi:hypothetical protein [Sphingosinicella sp.]|uniref:hypothetical protein n=1 Tax=Sphingosinicella sp. TaxID=1917971 RepID=UPI00403782DB